MAGPAIVGLEILGSSHWVCRVLWSIKKIRPSVWTRSSQPSGRGPKSSSWRRLGTLDCTGKAEGRPLRGSTQVVFLSLWLIKKTRPFGATCIVQPSGRPSWFKARLTWDWPEAEAPGPEAESRLDPESVSVMESDLIEGAGDPVDSPPIDKSWVIWINEESFAEGLKITILDQIFRRENSKSYLFEVVDELLCRGAVFTESSMLMWTRGRGSTWSSVLAGASWVPGCCHWVVRATWLT